MSNLSIFDFQSHNIRFDTRNGIVWVNLTDMAKASGKLIGDWNRLKSTTEFLNAFTQSMGFSIDQVLDSNESTGSNLERGTWAIKQIAIKFAAWCSVDFEIWMVNQIDTLITHGSVSLIPKSALQLAREQVSLLEQIEANEHTIALQDQQLIEYKPLVDFAKQIQFSDDSIDFNSFAKMIDTGRNRLFSKMRELKIIMKNSNLPYQRFCEAGYFEVSEKIIQGQRSDGSDYDYLVSFAMITGKGQLWLYNKLQSSPITSLSTV